MSGDLQRRQPDRDAKTPDGGIERAGIKRAAKAELSDLNHTVEASAELELTEATSREARDHAYENGFLSPGDNPGHQTHVITALQDLALVYGGLKAIPPEELRPILAQQTARAEKVLVRDAALERGHDNQDLLGLRDRFPSLDGVPLIEAMLAALDPRAPGYPDKANVLGAIRLLIASSATKTATVAAMRSGAAFSIATLRMIAVGYFADASVSEEQKSELRERLGFVEASGKAKGSIPANPRAFEQQLLERGTRTRREKITHPDGSVTYEAKTERSLEPIIYGNNGMPVEFHPDPINDRSWYVQIWRPSGPPMEFPVSSQEMLRGLSSINWALAYQALEGAGFAYPFGGRHSLEERGRMEQEYRIFSYGLGLRPAEGQMWTEELTRKTLHWMQSMHIRADWGQEDLDVDWRRNAERLGVYDVEHSQWSLEGLNWARDRLGSELATTGAPDFEILLNIMAEGGFGERANDGPDVRAA